MSTPIRPAEPEGGFVPSPFLRGIRALVVEDDVTTREVVQYLLQHCEAEVTATETAGEALHVFNAGLRGKRFDVVVSDIGLPRIGGLELMQRIRAMEQQESSALRTPAIALTAYDRDDNRGVILAAGFDTLLSKPVEARVLVQAVAQCVGRSLPNPDLKVEWNSGPGGT